MQEYKVIFDTASDLVAINGVFCLDCFGPKFDIKPDIANEAASLESLESIYSYGSQKIYAQEATGKVCLDLERCADDFTYLYISRNKGIFNELYSGVVGMARPRSYLLAPEEEPADPSRLIIKATNTLVFTLQFGGGSVSFCDLYPSDDACQPSPEIESEPTDTESSEEATEDVLSEEDRCFFFPDECVQTDDQIFNDPTESENDESI